jgi:hypothetical protein
MENEEVDFQSHPRPLVARVSFLDYLCLAGCWPFPGPSFLALAAGSGVALERLPGFDQVLDRALATTSTAVHHKGQGAASKPASSTNAHDITKSCDEALIVEMLV